jgi:hypothetical protein
MVITQGQGHYVAAQAQYVRWDKAMQLGAISQLTEFVVPPTFDAPSVGQCTGVIGTSYHRNA